MGTAQAQDVVPRTENLAEVARIFAERDALP
jgi:hypothetical protein